jgi:hypothetical protein
LPRGQAAKDGDTFVNANGYHHTRVEGRWRATHHLIIEEKLGRPIDHAVEMVRFADGDRRNLKPENIVIQARVNRRSKEAIITKLQSRIADLQAELELLLKEE